MSQYTHYKLRTSGQNVFTVPKPLSIITFAAEHPITDVLFPSSSVADHALWLPPVSTQSIISYHPEATLLNQGSALLLWPLINRQWFVFFYFHTMFYKYIAYLCVHACVCTQGSEKSIRSFEAGIYRMSSLLCGCWDPNSDTPDLSSHQPCLVLCFEFFFTF